MTENSTHQCCARSYGGHIGSTRCLSDAVIERAAKWYCDKHDPVARQRRMRETLAAQRRNEDTAAANRARRVAESLACAGVPTERLTEGLLKALLEGST